MQPMARPGYKQYPEAQRVAARPGWIVLLALDTTLHLVAAVLLAGATATGAIASRGVGVGLVLVAAGIAVSALGCMGLRPHAANWRRRLGFVALLAALWRRGPLDITPWLTLAIVVWQGAIWIGTLVEGRRITRAIVDATGEEGLGDDPSRHV